jgi:nucleobase:cation symporter-1, NCS1 family
VLKEAKMSDKHRTVSIAPVSGKERTLTSQDLAMLWFGAAISIAEIWAGGLPALTALGLGAGLVAIVFGRVIGNGLLAAMARIGADTGLPTMVLTRPALGVRGSNIPALLNVLQLIGWTGWMLFTGYLYLNIVATNLGLPSGESAPWMRVLWIVLQGALCTWWATGGHRFWKAIQRWSSIALLLLTIAMTAVVLMRYNVAALWHGAGWTPLAVLAAADLVIAMSVSWLPLVADYSRFATKGRAGASGTFWGYTIGGVWMYAVGLLVASSTGSSSPDQMVVTVMGGTGVAWAIAAVFLVLLATVTTTFLDIYSTVVSAQSLMPRLPEQSGTLAVGVIGTAVALALDVFGYQQFLEAIGAVFLPVFTVVLIDYFVLSGRRILTSQLATTGGAYWFIGGYNWRALVAWAAGFLVYDWARGFTSIGYFAKLAGASCASTPWVCGGSLPCIATAGLCYMLLVWLFGRGTK